MATSQSAKSVQSFLGAEAYNQLLATVGEDEIYEVNEKLSSRIEEHFQLKETLSSLKDENKSLRRGQKTSNRVLRKTKEKEEHLVQAYMRQTDEKFKCMYDLQLLIEGSIVHFEKTLETRMKDLMKSHERLLRTEKGKVKVEHKKRRQELESTQNRIRTVIKLTEQDDKEQKRENCEQALMDIFLEQTRNLEDQQTLEIQGMDRVFERLQKEQVQEYKIFSKAILHMKVNYQIIHNENMIEPTNTTEDKTSTEKDSTTNPEMKINTNQNSETRTAEEGALHVTNRPQACADETEAKCHNKEREKRSSKGSRSKGRTAPGPPPPTPSPSPPTS